MRVDTDDFARPCSCGKEHRIEVKEILIEPGAVNKLEEMMSDGFLKEYISPLIICDTNTYEATEEIMEDIYDRCQVIILDAEGLHANNQGVEIVEKNMDEDIDLILAVGSGTIHDLSRFVAHERRIPFVSVPTAASVDGFVSTVAAMTWNGMKKTMPAQAPVCVIADTDIFAKAPKRLNASGASDLFGKYICLADWKIANLLTGEYICNHVIEMEEQALKAVRACIRGVAAGNEEDCEELMYALILSGLAMQMVGNSRPASCAEHHMSHLWEMEIINDYVDALHGEKVSAGLILAAKEYKRIARAIRAGRCRVKSYPGLEINLLERTFGAKGLLKETIAENTPDPLSRVSPERLEACLDEIADIIDEIPDVEDLERILDKGGCVKSVRQIGISEKLIPLTLELSPYVRNRLSLMRVRKMLEIW
ncbi:MAG: sn-glycerol-1-phosphate dehydrogenase [Eubacteriales bacterium]|nr:sn-glycerol-1-phosphate dehydrogenase [Eubacteriales bacterium]